MKKLSLARLKVSSFKTNIDKQKTKTIKGGTDLICTGGMCTDIAVCNNTPGNTNDCVESGEYGCYTWSCRPECWKPVEPI